jgi:hypothetical protein
MKKMAMLLALTALLVVGLMGTGANAAPTGVFVFNGTASLNSGFPCTGACNGTFSGVARGVAANPTTNCATGCPMTASYTYNEAGGQCVGNTPAAPLGTANGTYSIGSITGNFSWTRVGVTAILLLNSPTGVAVAAFVPPNTCTPDTATVAGVAATV